MPIDGKIIGEVFEDLRGEVRFFNQFDMKEVVRFYEIVPAKTEDIRGWQGHEKEKKWFYPLFGSFIVNTVKINDFNNPCDTLKITKHILNASKPELLCVGPGHATAIKAITDKARLQVFSNFGLKESKEDDFRYPLNKWAFDSNT